MYFMRKSNTMYRDFGNFGYITDNRNFGYRFFKDNGDNNIGDRIVSHSGSIFLSVLERRPQSIEDIIKKISAYFVDTDIKEIKRDILEFYHMLEVEGFIVSGLTIEECIEKEKYEIYYGVNGSIQSKQISKESNVKDNTTQEFFDNYFKGKPQLTHVHIEITSKCNERCIHCYIPHEKKTNIMEAEMFYNILKQCRDLNVLNITISGGEPLSHRNFLDFLRKCYEYNFSVNVLSNLTLIDNEIIREMKMNPLICVQTSLYSMDADVHDEITKVKGSFLKTKSAILKLIENGIPIQISCPIMKQNLGSYNEVVKWGNRNNVNVNSDFVIIGRYDHSIDNLNCRLSMEDIRNITTDKIKNSKEYSQSLEKSNSDKKWLDNNDYICSVCHSSICISEEGIVYPCAGWQGFIIENINNKKLKDIWNNSPKISYLRDLRRKDFPKCLSCSERDFCTMCMVRNANESPTGDYLKVNSYYCEIARITKELFYKMKGQKY